MGFMRKLKRHGDNKRYTYIVCDKCGNTLQMPKKTLPEDWVEVYKDGHSDFLRLQYLQCSKCGAIYPIMLDNAASLQLMDAAIRAADPVTGKLKGKEFDAAVKFRRELARKWDGGDFVLLGVKYPLKMPMN